MISPFITVVDQHGEQIALPVDTIQSIQETARGSRMILKGQTEWCNGIHLPNVKPVDVVRGIHSAMMHVSGVLIPSTEESESTPETDPNDLEEVVTPV